MSTLISIVSRIALGAVGLGGSGLGLSPILWVIRRRRARRMALWAQVASQPAPLVPAQAPNATEQMSMPFPEQPAPPAAQRPAPLSAAISYPMPVAPMSWLLSDALMAQPMLRRRRHFRGY